MIRPPLPMQLLDTGLERFGPSEIRTDHIVALVARVVRMPVAYKINAVAPEPTRLVEQGRQPGERAQLPLDIVAREFHQRPARTR